MSVCHLSCKILFPPSNYYTPWSICRVSVSPSASRREISRCERHRLLSRRPICIQLGSARQLTRSANNNNRPECAELFLRKSHQRGRLCVGRLLRNYMKKRPGRLGRGKNTGLRRASCFNACPLCTGNPTSKECTNGMCQKQLK
jgi:hypothetical protein